MSKEPCKQRPTCGNMWVSFRQEVVIVGTKPFRITYNIQYSPL